jgi:ABC-type lipoprotein release transport system permease subunit
MFSLFGATAATLCALGTFGLVSYVLARSRREWAIRLALGATPWRIIRAAVLRGIGPLIGGCVSGLLAAAVFTRVIESYLFDLNRLDPVSFGIAALVLLVPGSAAAFIAARALRRLDPGPELKEH